ncbi:hypothetical protein MesoLj113c_01980 [Mesorhizobium sp. 113-3-9]|nr:hypothetical protein MesoLj113c_01980 [Mesorhizobium sp. 113-3-9]
MEGRFARGESLFDGALMNESVGRIKRQESPQRHCFRLNCLFNAGVALVAPVSQSDRFAPPLIVLPDISPRKVTGRKTPPLPRQVYDELSRED